MFGFGGGEILLIIFVILMLFGSDKVPEMARTLGKVMAQLKNATNEIKSEIQKAAQNGEVYHLWWHPHNFGIHQEANFKFLESILKHYQYLNVTYQFSSCTMAECAHSQY